MFKFSCLVATALIAGIIMGTSSPAIAQSIKAPPPPRMTIPLEVALVYHKLLNTPPNFDQLAQYSPKLENAGTFGREALLTQEKSTLENVYKNTKRDQLIVVQQAMAVDTINVEDQQISIKNLDGDTPFTFEVGPTTFGVFIRNTNFINPISAPFYKTPSWSTLAANQRAQRHVILELTLRPRGADEANFTTYDDRIVKPIIADLIDLKIIDPRFTENLLVHKRDEKAFIEATKLETLVDDELTSDVMPSFNQ
jgi:hypothetical protein